MAAIIGAGAAIFLAVIGQTAVVLYFAGGLTQTVRDHDRRIAANEQELSDLRDEFFQIKGRVEAKS